MFFKSFPKIKYLRRSGILEQLEERIVLDAAVPCAVDQNTPDTDQTTLDNDQQLQAADTPQAENDADPNPDGDQSFTGDQQGDDLRVMLISNALDHMDKLSEAADEDVKVVVFDSNQDDLDSINQKLSDIVQLEGREIDRLAIFSHGDIGELRLFENTSIELSNIDSHREILGELGSLMSDSGGIDLYGCSIGMGPEGMQFVQTLADCTNADIWASDDPTGAATGYDWDLEVGTGVGPAETLLDYSALDSTTIRLDWDTTPTSGNDSIYGQGVCGSMDALAGNDTITNWSGKCTGDIEGGAGDDEITLDSTFTCIGNIRGGTGEDTLRVYGSIEEKSSGAGGNVDGGDGDDFIHIYDGATVEDEVLGKGGDDTIWVDVGADLQKTIDGGESGETDGDLLTIYVSSTDRVVYDGAPDAGELKISNSQALLISSFSWKNFEYVNIDCHDSKIDLVIADNSQVTDTYLGGGNVYKNLIIGKGSTARNIHSGYWATDIDIRENVTVQKIYGGEGNLFGQDDIIIGDRSNVGYIYLGKGVDYVTIGAEDGAGATVNEIYVEEGGGRIIVNTDSIVGDIKGGPDYDQIFNGGVVGTIDGGGGQDSITNCKKNVWYDWGFAGSVKFAPGGGVVTTIIGGTGNDTITNDGEATTIEGGTGNDTIECKWDSSCDAIDAGGGDDHILITGNSAKFVTINGKIDCGSGDDDVFIYYATVRGDVSGSDGLDDICISTLGTVDGDVIGGQDNDNILIEGVIEGSVNGNLGADLIGVYSGGRVEGQILGGDPTTFQGDTLFINPRPDNTVSLTSPGNCVFNGHFLYWDEIEYVAVGPGNHAPVLGNENLQLTDIDEDIANSLNSGNTVSSRLT